MLKLGDFLEPIAHRVVRSGRRLLRILRAGEIFQDRRSNRALAALYRVRLQLMRPTVGRTGTGAKSRLAGRQLFGRLGGVPFLLAVLRGLIVIEVLLRQGLMVEAQFQLALATRTRGLLASWCRRCRRRCRRCGAAVVGRLLCLEGADLGRNVRQVGVMVDERFLRFDE